MHRFVTRTKSGSKPHSKARSAEIDRPVSPSRAQNRRTNESSVLTNEAPASTNEERELTNEAPVFTNEKLAFASEALVSTNEESVIANAATVFANEAPVFTNEEAVFVNAARVFTNAEMSFKEDRRENRVVQFLNRRVLRDDIWFLAVPADCRAGGFADGGDFCVLQDARSFFLGKLGEEVVDR